VRKSEEEEEEGIVEILGCSREDEVYTEKNIYISQRIYIYIYNVYEYI